MSSDSQLRSRSALNPTVTQSCVRTEDVVSPVHTLSPITAGVIVATCASLLGAVAAVMSNADISITTVSLLLAILAGVSATATA